MNEKEQIIADITSIIESRYFKNMKARVKMGVEGFSLKMLAYEHLLLTKALLEDDKVS